jgi:hypothetical protein
MEVFMKGEIKPLIWWINNLASMERDVWLWIPDETGHLVESTACVAISSEELSPEEQDKQEAQLEQSGLRCFLHKDQIEDIAVNLRQQKPIYSLAELFHALNFYWSNDAFIDIENA